MNIYISENIKRLRREKNFTQEALADFIGISFQAVSKWECGDAYPDITLLPTLANFFEVTVDELIGMNEIKDAKKLEEIKKQHIEIVKNGGTEKEIIELWRDGLKTFPNDYWLLSQLAINLSNSGDTDEERKKNNEESIKISERILAFCTDTEIRNGVQAQMCHSLYNIGEKEKAVELAKKLPKLHETRERVLRFISDGKEIIKQSQHNIFDYTYELTMIIWGFVHAENDGYYSEEERFMLAQKAINISKAVFEEGDCDLGHYYLSNICVSMAKIYINRGNKDEAVKSLEEAAKHTIALLNRSDEMRKSLLVNTMSGIRLYMVGANHAKLTKNQIEGEPFESIRDREEIKNILTELDKYAN